MVEASQSLVIRSERVRETRHFAFAATQSYPLVAALRWIRSEALRKVTSYVV